MDAASQSPAGEGAGRHTETFPSPSATFGWFGLVVVAAFVALVLSDGRSVAHWAVAAGLLLVGAAVVSVNIRPSLLLCREHLLVRNALTDVRVPWTSIEMVEVRQVMEIDVGDGVVRALAFGRTLRQQHSHAAKGAKLDMTAAERGAALPGADYTDLVASRLIDTARSRGGGRLGSREEGAGQPVVRTWRWPEVAVLGVLAGLTVVLGLLAV